MNRRAKNRATGGEQPETQLSILFVGAVVPPAEADLYPAFSIAGNLWQTRLLTALEAQGLKCERVYSARPVPSFPRFRRLLIRSGNSRLPHGPSIFYLPFFNLGPLKTVSLAISNFVSLLISYRRHSQGQAKAIVTYNVNSPHGLSTSLAAKLLHVKAIAIIADLPMPGHGIVPRTLVRRIEFFLQVKSLPLFDGLVVLTRNIGRDFAPSAPSLLLEGAIDGQLMRSRGNSTVPKPDTPVVLMYAGLLTEFDGVPLLLRAFSLINDDCYRLWIVGKGPEQASVEEAARSDARISFFGYLPHERVLDLYPRAHILVNPRPSAPRSTQYVFPSKLLEFIATGCPVITTATAEVAEEYEQFTFILDDETPDGLAQLVQRVASLPAGEREAIGRSARQHMLQHKTWQVQGERFAEFVRVCLDSPPT